MNTPPQTTEFSAHLSWAAMRRYLQETLPAEKSQRVKRHLHHCPRCSSAIIDYIQAEEPEHYKQYTKKLKGILKTGQAEKKNVLSSFQIKALRTTTAVVALLIFSFFAFKTVINKQADYALPSTSLAVAEKSEKITPVRRRPAKKIVEVTAETQKKPKERLKVTEKKRDLPKENARAAAPAVITKVRTAALPKTAAVADPVRQGQPRIEPTLEVADVSTDRSSSPAPQEEASVPQEEVTDASDNETARRKPLPTLQKIGAAQSAAAVDPLGESSPTEMPVPSNEILER